MKKKLHKHERKSIALLIKRVGKTPYIILKKKKTTITKQTNTRIIEIDIGISKVLILTTVS